MNNITILTGHTSPETAYVVNDYPYGFRLRCKIRYWLERAPNARGGVRFCSQTTNPKVAGEVWNKPKKSTFHHGVGVMFLDERGHVGWVPGGIASWDDALGLVHSEIGSAAPADLLSTILDLVQLATSVWKNNPRLSVPEPVTDPVTGFAPFDVVAWTEASGERSFRGVVAWSKAGTVAVNNPRTGTVYFSGEELKRLTKTGVQASL